MQSSAYWKANYSTKKRIDVTSEEILRNNDILNPVEINVESNYFFTFKNRKGNSANNPQDRLMKSVKN